MATEAFGERPDPPRYLENMFSCTVSGHHLQSTLLIMYSSIERIQKGGTVRPQQIWAAHLC